MKHKHAELIIAWANGAQIQIKNNSTGWEDMDCTPSWADGFKYRIKPEPKHDWEKLVRIETHRRYICSWKEDFHGANLRLIFNGDTGKLKSAEVL